MTNLERMKLRTGEANEAVLIDCLESAKNAILSRRFPYGGWPTEEYEVDVPPVTNLDPETGEEVVVTPGRTETVVEAVLEPQYLDLQYRIALSIYNKDGGEFEISHSENGVVRSYASEGIPESLLAEVVPMCGIVR